MVLYISYKIHEPIKLYGLRSGLRIDLEKEEDLIEISILNLSTKISKEKVINADFILVNLKKDGLGKIIDFCCILTKNC